MGHSSLSHSSGGSATSSDRTHRPACSCRPRPAGPCPDARGPASPGQRAHGIEELHEQTIARPTARRDRPRSGSARASFTAIALVVMVIVAWCAGCSSDSASDAPVAADSTATTRGSLFDSNRIPVRAVIVTRGQHVYPLQSMRICGCPYSDAYAALQPVRQDWEREVADIETAVAATETSLRETRVVLASEEADIAAKHAELVPTADSIPENARNRAVLLAKARANRAKADEFFREAYADRIEPVKRDISILEEQLRSQRSLLATTIASLDEREFTALEREAVQTWTTNEEGRTTISLPDASPWLVWAKNARFIAAGRFSETEFYRWALKVPDSLDSNGILMFDNGTLFGPDRLITGPVSRRDPDSQFIQVE